MKVKPVTAQAPIQEASDKADLGSYRLNKVYLNLKAPPEESVKLITAQGTKQ